MNAVRLQLLLLLVPLLLTAVACGPSGKTRAGSKGTKSKTPAAAHTVVDLEISGMRGAADATALREALEKVEGVKRAKVDAAKGKANVLMTTSVSKADFARVVETLRDAVPDRLAVTGVSMKSRRLSSFALE